MYCKQTKNELVCMFFCHATNSLESAKMPHINGSKVFIQTRALGYVSNGVPHRVRYITKRREHLVATCVGNAFHTYGCEKFSLLSVSPQHPDKINCLAADTFLIYTACGSTIFAWRRGVELKHTYSGHAKPVHLLLPFGAHLVSVDEDSTLIVWDVKAEEVYTEVNFDNKDFRVSAICHPYTYINKILLASEQGSMRLWNINRSVLIYSFTGWNCRITALEPAPAVNVVAVGLENGKIILHNLKADTTLYVYQQGWGEVTSISFLTDGQPVMVTGSVSGKIVIWNLNERRIVNQLLNAHSGSVSAITCLTKEPLMVSSSPDNSLKLWIFDMSDGGARLLRVREGHNSPPTFIRFYDLLGNNLISAGGDSSLRVFNLVTEIANKSFGRASHNRTLLKKKKNNSKKFLMSPISRFAHGIPNNVEFDDIAAVHVNDVSVSTWSFHYERMSEEHILHDRFKAMQKPLKVTASCLCFSNCMNFIIVGYTSGHADRFNIQSGIHRASYGESVAHNGVVRGVATDSVDKVVITGGSDRRLKFWLFQSSEKKHLFQTELEDSVSFFSSHTGSSLLAVALENFAIHLVDIEFRSIVRKFCGHIGEITDICFSPDLRWLISSAMDTTIRIWDIPSGQLIDYIVVEVPCISLSFSPTGEYLATAHLEHFGVYLWANKTLFNHVSLRPLSDSDVQITAPLSLNTFSSVIEDGDVSDNEVDLQYEANKENDWSREQISDLITLSETTSTTWQKILDIDIVKKRNKPKQPPKKPEAAPFFLPTVNSLNLEFDFSDIKEKQQQRNKSNQQQNQIVEYGTVFSRLLAGTVEDDFSSAIEKIKTLSPSAVYLEVTSLSFNEDDKCQQLLTQFMKMIEKMFLERTNFELAQSYLGIFLKVHDTTIMNNAQLVFYLRHLLSVQEKMWKNLESQLLYCLSIVDYLKNI